jgi:hypothetical protein
MKHLTPLLFLIAASCAQHPAYAQAPAPTAHEHSSAARALMTVSDLAWAAAYCDEENAFVRCYQVTKHGPKFNVSLGSNVGNVAVVMFNGKVLKPTQYYLTHRERPLPPEPEGFHAMTAKIYTDNLTIVAQPIDKPEMVVVFFNGYKTYHPHHAEDDVK